MKSFYRFDPDLSLQRTCRPEIRRHAWSRVARPSPLLPGIPLM